VVEERVFRTSAAYQLVLFDRLAPEEQAAFGDLAVDPDFYGILRPAAGSGGTVKAVGRDTALLLLTLREPGSLPSYLRRAADSRNGREITALVLDGVLEVADGDRFLSGPGAVALLDPARGEPGGGGRLAALSRDALRYADALGLDDPHRISARLYGYHRLPLAPRWLRRFDGNGGVARALGLSSGGGVASGWSAHDRAAEGWLVFTPRRPPSAPSPGGGASYKLYLSPLPEALGDAVAGLRETLPRCRAQQLKIGADAAGLLRPDKIVLYFSGFEGLAEAADRLGERLAGLAVHGVPFTAEAAGDGLLSWGIDPPSSVQLPSWRGRESWRLWLTNRLAVALLAGRRAAEEDPEVVAPWRFALARLAADGIDVERWVPEPSVWREPGREEL
jgi:hypothetical protein